MGERDREGDGGEGLKFGPGAPGRGGAAPRRAPVSGEVEPSTRGRSLRRGGDIEDDGGPSAEDIERFSHATRKCPNCRKEVFDDVDVCYHCGEAIVQASKGPKPWVLIVVVLMIIGFIITSVGRFF
jgi:hypothetical protein